PPQGRREAITGERGPHGVICVHQWHVTLTPLCLHAVNPHAILLNCPAVCPKLLWPQPAHAHRPPRIGGGPGKLVTGAYGVRHGEPRAPALPLLERWNVGNRQRERLPLPELVA